MAYPITTIYCVCDEFLKATGLTTKVKAIDLPRATLHTTIRTYSTKLDWI